MPAPYYLPAHKGAELSQSMLKALRSMAAGATAQSAARSSGIQLTDAFWEYHQSPRFVKDLAAACGHRIETFLVPLALAALERALQPTAPLRLQIDAAKIVADRGGFPARPAHERADGDKAVEQMTREELYAFVKAGEAKIAEAESKLAELAMPVDAA